MADGMPLLSTPTPPTPSHPHHRRVFALSQHTPTTYPHRGSVHQRSESYRHMVRDGRSRAVRTGCRLATGTPPRAWTLVHSPAQSEPGMPTQLLALCSSSRPTTPQQRMPRHASCARYIISLVRRNLKHVWRQPLLTRPRGWWPKRLEPGLQRRDACNA